MGQDKYTKFMLTVIALSVFLIALNLSAIEFALYHLYNEEMENFLSKISSRIDEISLRMDRFSSHVDEMSTSMNNIVDAIKKR